MKRISKIALLITFLCLGVWQLPWWYNYFFHKDQNNAAPFILYSPVINNCAYNLSTLDGKIEGRDIQGNRYTSNQLDSILPFFYYRQLADRKSFPTHLMGQRVNSQMAAEGSFMFRTYPDDINGPKTPLYMLLESAPERLDFTFPPDVFRCTHNGLEFIKMKTNSIDICKSQEFTRILKEKGCTFPLFRLHSLPSLRKTYDNGFLIVDANKHLFQLKMTKGNAVCRRIDLPSEIRANHIFVTEFEDRKSLGFITDQKNQFYVITLPSYQVKKIAIPSFDPSCQQMLIVGNPLVWTVRIEDFNQVSFYGINAHSYNLLKKKRYVYNDDVFVGLHFTSPMDGYVKVRWN